MSNLRKSELQTQKCGGCIEKNVPQVNEILLPTGIEINENSDDDGKLYLAGVLITNSSSNQCHNCEKHGQCDKESKFDDEPTEDNNVLYPTGFRISNSIELRRVMGEKEEEGEDDSGPIYLPR